MRQTELTIRDAEGSILLQLCIGDMVVCPSIADHGVCLAALSEALAMLCGSNHVDNDALVTVVAAAGASRPVSRAPPLKLVD